MVIIMCVCVCVGKYKMKTFGDLDAAHFSNYSEMMWNGNLECQCEKLFETNLTMFKYLNI